MKGKFIVILIALLIFVVPTDLFSVPTAKKPNDYLEKQLAAQLKLLRDPKHDFFKMNEPRPAVRSLRWLDLDSDGVPDHEDDCPTIYGVPERNGCPNIDMSKSVTVTKPTIIFTEKEFWDAVQAFAGLTFDGSNLLSQSYAGLDRFVDLLKDKPTWTVCLSAYVEDTPDESTNYSLSKIRLMRVKNYLIKKGISQKRISGKYFGDTMPVIDLPSSRFEVEISK